MMCAGFGRVGGGCGGSGGVRGDRGGSSGLLIGGDCGGVEEVMVISAFGMCDCWMSADLILWLAVVWWTGMGYALFLRHARELYIKVLKAFYDRASLKSENLLAFTIVLLVRVVAVKAIQTRSSV